MVWWRSPVACPAVAVAAVVGDVQVKVGDALFRRELRCAVGGLAAAAAAAAAGGLLDDDDDDDDCERMRPLH